MRRIFPLLFMFVVICQYFNVSFEMILLWFKQVVSMFEPWLNMLLQSLPEA